MSTTMESKSNKHTRVSTLNVRPSVAGIIADSDGNLDEKKAVAALSQTHKQNKHMWIACFVLIGVVLILIAANIGTSVAVARLTRQLNVDPVTGMATIAGSDDVVMKTSIAVYKEDDISFHNVPIDYLSAVKTVEFKDGDISLDVKGFARMTNETILLVEGGSFVFDVNGFKNITGDGLTRLFSYIGEDMESSDLHGRKLCWGMDCFWDNVRAGAARATAAYSAFSVPTMSAPTSAPAPRDNRCGFQHNQNKCNNADLPYCDEHTGWCGNTAAHRDNQYSNYFDWQCSDSNPDRTTPDERNCVPSHSLFVW